MPTEAIQSLISEPTGSGAVHVRTTANKSISVGRFERRHREDGEQLWPRHVELDREASVTLPRGHLCIPAALRDSRFGLVVIVDRPLTSATGTTTWPPIKVGARNDVIRRRGRDTSHYA